MERDPFINIDFNQITTPAFVVCEQLLERNLHKLAIVRQRTGANVLLALKGYAQFSLFPLIRKYLQGVCASSVHEARLGREEFGREVHAYAAAFSERDISELVSLVDHVSFNSFHQLYAYGKLMKQNNISIGLRVNPEQSEAPVPLYDPCAPGSRLGIRRSDFNDQDLSLIKGLHFHTLCEQNSDALERTVAAFEKLFSEIIPQMEWINFGGGHHITRGDYDIDLLCHIINTFKKRYSVQVYLEPGEAVALNTGVLVSRVLDIVQNEIDIAVLDTSAAAHMPDVLEMPYRPEVIGALLPGEEKYTYRLAGNSCLAGDVIGDYSFQEQLRIGDTIVFRDMAHYTMVKTNTFNGLRLPSIINYNADTGKFNIIRTFGYEDFKGRLS